MSFHSTRKKAFAKAKRNIAAGARYAAVPYRRKGATMLRQYRKEK